MSRGDLALDNAGGVIVSWGRSDGLCTRGVFAQRFIASGLRQWGDHGILVAIEDPTDTHMLGIGTTSASALAIPDNVGGAFITNPFRAQHVAANGTIASGWPASGVVLASGTGARSGGSVIADGFGGFFIAWIDERSVNPGLYMQRVTSTGTIAAGWPTASLLVEPGVPGGGTQTQMISDNAGGALVFWGWSDTLRAQRVLGDATTQWGPHGVVVSASAPESWMYNGIVRDGSGGALAAWFGPTSRTDLDVSMQHITILGGVAPSWPASGKLLCNADGDQWLRLAIADGAGGAFFGWDDHRAGQYNGYVQHVSSSGPTAVPPDARSIERLRVSPNPTAGKVRVSFVLGSALPACVDLVDVSGRLIESKEVAGAGGHAVSLASARTLPAGVYFVRLTGAGGARTTRLVLLR